MENRILGHLSSSKSGTWKDEKRLMYLDKEITELEYKSLLIKRQKELEFIEETIGFYETISEVCKIYFINKINNLPNEIEFGFKNIKPLELKKCETHRTEYSNYKNLELPLQRSAHHGILCEWSAILEECIFTILAQA